MRKPIQYTKQSLSERSINSRESRQTYRHQIHSSLGLDFDSGVRSTNIIEYEKERPLSFRLSSLRKFMLTAFLSIIVVYLINPIILSDLSSSIKENLKETSNFDNDEETQKYPQLNHKEKSSRFKNFRDVVTDVPVDRDDVVIFWAHHGSDCKELKDAYSACYDVKFNVFDATERAFSDISSYGRNTGFYSTDLKELDELLTNDQQGRIFAFFRHPFYTFLEQINAEQTYQNSNNIITRTLCGDYDSELTFREIGDAKRVMRENFVVGLLDENLEESFHRIADYYGWRRKGDPECENKFLSAVKPDYFGEMMHDNSEQWEGFRRLNSFDLQVYEYARSLYRSQIHTIKSLEKQLLLKDLKA